MTRARIDVSGLAVFAHHGVLSEEARLGQRFVLDLCVEADIGAAVADDAYAHALCYATLCELAVSIATGERFNLIETLASRLCDAVLERFSQAHRIEVTVHKPAAPIPLPTGDISVTVARERLRPVAFSLGSNQGDSAAILQLAVNRLATCDGIIVERVSGLYKTAPWGLPDQPDFLNLCVVGRTRLAPLALLRAAKDIEIELGRAPGLRWGPRAVDIDLLTLGETVWHDHVLTLPHPRLAERAFVLVPLAEIAPEMRVAGRGVVDLLTELPRQPGDVEALTAAEERR